MSRFYKCFSKCLIILGAVTFGLLSFAQASDAKTDKVFNASQTTLSNGLQVIVVPNHRVPVVTQMVWYKVGAADEQTGQSGIAHFLEHLMFKGSDVIGGEPLAPGEFSRIVKGLGGQDNAFTSQDYTAYFQSVPASALEQVMRMEAGRMRGANPPLDQVASENKVILEERRQRTDNDPRGRFGEQLMAAAFVNHPYGTPIIGWYHEMEKLNWDIAKPFYDAHYGPNNAILIITGDVEPVDVFALAQDIYGQIPANDAIPPRIRTTSPVLNSQTSVTLAHPAIRETVLQTLYRAPSYRQNKKAALALQVLEEIMSGGQSARLYQAMVVKNKIASSAGLAYQADAYDDGRLWVYANPLPEVSVDDLQAALDDQLRLLITDGVTDDELNDAITRMQDAAIFARDSLSGPAMTIGYSLATGSTLDDVENWPAQIGRVSAIDVQEAARAYLNPDAPRDTPPVRGVLMPKESE